MERAKPAVKTIYTTHDVSRLLHVNPRSVINWIEQELLHSYRTPGGHRRIRHDDLLAFLRKHQIPTPAALLGESFNILLVEDEEDVTRVISTYFERVGGFKVTTVSDGISALIEMGRIRPDVMILDIKIPGVDGVEVCRRIKADRSNKTAIIAISGQAENESRILQAGADAFLAKPLNLDQLNGEVKKLLQVL
jgi:excisionase family DNA binding protein